MSNHQDPTQNFQQLAEKAAREGHVKEALEFAICSCANSEASAAALSSAALIAVKAGDYVRAAEWYERAYKIQPSKPWKVGHAKALMDAGNLGQAETVLREALDRWPDEFQILTLLGVAIKRAGRYHDALEWFSRAAKLGGKGNSPWVNMGNCHMALEAPAKAADCFQRAIKLDPSNAESHRLLGRALLEQHHTDKAITAFKNALHRGARDPWAYMDLANAYHVQKRLDQALEVVVSAAEIFRDHRPITRQRGSILRSLGRVAEAKEIFEDLLQTQPDDVETLVYLGNLHLWALNNRQEANALYERALKIAPNDVGVATSYVESLANSRYGDEMAHFQRSYEVACSLLEAVANPLSVAGALQNVFLRAVDYERASRLGNKTALIQRWVKEATVSRLHNQLGRVQTMEDRLALLRAHVQWGDRVQDQAKRNPIRSPARAIRCPPEKIRIGIMSSDLRHHPVTYFAQPIFEFYDRSRFDVYCYSFYPGKPDAVQQRLNQIVSCFRVLAGRSSQEVAQTISDDGIDILFELGGTTLMNKVEVCAWRPAPVQVSWLGYPHSAGLSSIDYILVDPFNRPDSDSLLIEKPFLMPETWVSLGSLGFYDIPIEPRLPQDRQGCITFGTANSPYKYTLESFAAWAQILRAVDESKFLFLRPEGGAPAFRNNVLRIFKQLGVDPDRIGFEAVRGTHMPHYNRIDIALDPFPHVGGTTTCESLWMGVPVVTLVGPAFFERLSASNLQNAGLGNLCAISVDEYIRIAIELAKDRERRLSLRYGLRDQIRANPLGQTKRFTRNFEAVITRTLETH